MKLQKLNIYLYAISSLNSFVPSVELIMQIIASSLQICKFENVIPKSADPTAYLFQNLAYARCAQVANFLLLPSLPMRAVSHPLRAFISLTCPTRICASLLAGKRGHRSQYCGLLTLQDPHYFIIQASDPTHQHATSDQGLHSMEGTGDPCPSLEARHPIPTPQKRKSWVLFNFFGKLGTNFLSWK